MDSQAIDHMKQHASHVDFKTLLILTVGGGLAFFTTTIAFSLLPAAEYRAALSMSYGSVVTGGSISGLIIAFCISRLLLRFGDRMPAESAVAKALMISGIALLLAIGLVGVAARGVPADGWRYFFIGTMLNVPRFLAIGIAIGYLHTRLCGSPTPA